MDKSILTKKAQVWSLDLAVASLIFLMGIIILYLYAFNYLSQSDSSLKDIFYEGNVAAEILLSENSPGLLSNNKINQTKIDNFNEKNYTTKKRELNMHNDFYFTIDNLESNGQPIGYIGMINSSSIKNKIKITRFTIYKNKPSKLEFFVWK